ncbi:MAG: hypothetical protein CMC05_12435 [Flavobacteriaceae bacterium]|nr:hypothetical protein [Flavobacteriaceae bacterium]|tara:strand:+ start:6060 stop:6626 length:567 start_codon:yes stop_codon:yes gene_type:complete
MKIIKPILLFVFSLMLCCQSDTDIHKDDWQRKFIKQIDEYNKKGATRKLKTLNENDNEYLISIYAKDKTTNIQKIKIELNLESNLNVSQEFYLLNDNIIMEKFKGISPLIYKGKKKDSDPCCEVFEKNIYYKNSKIGNIYKKRLKINSVEDFDYEKDLESISFEESKEVDITKELVLAQSWLEEILAI